MSADAAAARAARDPPDAREPGRPAGRADRRSCSARSRGRRPRTSCRSTSRACGRGSSRTVSGVSGRAVIVPRVRPATSSASRPGASSTSLRFERLAEEGRRALAGGDRRDGARRSAASRRSPSGVARRSPTSSYEPFAPARAHAPRRAPARGASRTASRPTSPSVGRAALVGEFEALVAAVPAARAAPWPADARALPLRTPGRGARGLPGRAPRARRRARARAVARRCRSSSGRSCARIRRSA